MSKATVTIAGYSQPPKATPAPAARSFLGHAKLIAMLTLVSRVLGLARETVSAHYFGAGLVSSAFATAFAIPNLFRKLFGEGALSAAFIPLYAQAIKQHHEDEARRFAAASVNLLCLALLAITLVGEAVLFAAILLWPELRPDWLLTLKLTAVMLPYVVLICGTAFLSSILQVHRRFGMPAAAPILLNAIHIVAIVLGARLLHLSAHEHNERLAEVLQTRLAYWLGFFVLVAGFGQLLMLWPALRQIGFRPAWGRPLWTPQIRKMVLLSVPIAIGAGVLQLSVMMDKAISMGLAQYPDRATGAIVTHFHLLGRAIRLPLEVGATARLTWAQYLYQFPLGVFAIALATAIFPSLSADALDRDREQFRKTLRHGIEATFWEGLPASLGLILVREPAIRLLFQHGQIDSHAATLIGQSVLYYAGAIWAFSLLQIVNRAYYAIHDTVTPLTMSAINLVVNIAVEVPLLWWMGEAGIAVGTLVSFSLQAAVMLFMLDRKIGGLNLSQCVRPVTKMLVATAVMGIACWAVIASPLYPTGQSRLTWATQLSLLLILGAGVYVAACAAMGVGIMKDLLPRRWRK